MKNNYGYKFKKRKCVLCCKLFNPVDLRSITCHKCRNYKCPSCGVKLKTSVARILKNKNRMCVKCYKNHNPIGSIKINSNGYRYIKIKIGAGRGFDNWMPEHRYVVELNIGRKLKHSEIVHHIDGDKTNNNINNLIVCKSLREHLDKFHKDDLKNPPTHHNGRRRKFEQGWKAIT